MATSRPLLTELARDDHGYGAAADYTQLLINPDSVLAARGHTATTLAVNATLAIYDELLRDDQVKSTFAQRRSAVTAAEWEVEPASDSAADTAAAEFIRDQLKRVGWDEVTDQMLYGVYYGYAVAEMLWELRDGKVGIDAIRVRERGRFSFDLGYRLRLSDHAHPDGLLLPERKFWVFNTGASTTDNPYGLGLAHSLYWPVFFKRSDLKFWLIFLEKFGMPTAAGRLPGGLIDDAEARRRALEALQAIQTDSAVVIGDDMVVELIEAARSGTADYAGLYERMDKAISKIVLSQTMTTDDGSSRSQAEVHRSVAQAVIKADADLLCESFNRGPVAWLTAWNFPGATPPRVFRHTEPPEDLHARAERDNKIASLGYEPTEAYIEETYGPGWRRKPTPAEAPADPLAAMGADFTEVSKLALARAGHRADQQSIADAAEYLATHYRSLYGKRIDQIMSYLEDTQDAATFRQRLDEMLADVPPPATQEPIRNATWVARLMGRLRNQREQ